MAGNLLSALGAQNTTSFVNEAAGQTSIPLWPNLRVLDVDFNAPSDVTNSPLSPMSNNTTDILPLKIIQPTHAKVTALYDDIATMQAVLKIYNDVTSTVTIKSRGIVAQSMVLIDGEIELGPESLSAGRVTLTFEQASPPHIQGYNASQSSDSTTQGLGVQSINSAASGASLGSIFTSISNSLGGL